MVDSVYKTPQLHIIGKVSYAKDFDCYSLYLKYTFKSGTYWNNISGSISGETFESIINDEQIAPLEHPFDINYSTKSMRGWPRLVIEVWQTDSEGKSSIGGYGILSIPMKSGHHKCKIYCWRPQASWADKLLGTHPELEFKDILISTQNKFALKTESTGEIVFEFDLLLKDFHLHGICI